MIEIISAPTLATAHEKIIKYIVEKGYYIYTEDKEHTVETDTIAVYIDTPFRLPRISPYAPQQDMAAKEYARQLIEGSVNEFDYTYHGQLFEWNTDYIHGHKVVHNQVQYLIDKLKETQDSRRAVAIVFDPMKHQYTDKSVPCLQLVQFVYRNGRLHLKVIFRSNDMLTASGLNMYGLTELQKFVASKVGMPVGSYTHIALVPHLYHIRDSKHMMDMVNGINKRDKDIAQPIKIQQWILDNIDKFSKTGGI